MIKHIRLENIATYSNPEILFMVGMGRAKQLFLN